MKNVSIILAVLSVLVMSTGCSGTWEGVKSDTSNAVDSTREAIHEATK